MPDIGNPNFFKIYRGRYPYTDANGATHYVMVGNTGEVVFMDALTSNANKILGQMATEATPTENIIFLARTSSDNSIGWVRVKSDGVIDCEKANQVYQLRGISYNMSLNWYK